MKQTAVEWLYEEFTKTNYLTEDEFYMKFNQAKEMEKEQIIEACNEWFTEGCRYATGFEQTLWQDEEDYYNKTFKQQQQ